MYIFLKRLLREILSEIIIRKTDKISDEKLIDNEKIEQKYGRDTYVLDLYYAEYILSGSGFFKWFFVIAGIISIAGSILYTLFDQILPEDKIFFIGAPCVCVFFVLLIKINEDIYKYYKNIITKDKIIMRRAYKKDRIVTYEEISEAAKKKKVVIKKAVIYIPTKKKPLRIEVFGSIYSELVLEKIKQKSKIAIPKLTEKRKKCIGQAAMSGLYNFFGLLLAFSTLVGAYLWSSNNGVGYLIAFTTLPMNMFALATFACFVIGKIYFMVGQYKLRKDINDRKHVKIRLL